MVEMSAYNRNGAVVGSDMASDRSMPADAAKIPADASSSKDVGSSSDAAGRLGFIGSRSETACDSALSLCKGKVAGCVMDDTKYLKGTFPGSRRVMVKTTAGAWKIKVSLFLEGKASPGTETEISWYEPACSDVFKHQQSKAGSDLFTAAGSDNTFEIEHSVAKAGDHLVEIFSDATTRYLLRVEAIKGP